MKEWYGIMDWSLDENWKCEICGNIDLIWGIQHGTCRCEVCHTQYRMRDEKGKIVKIPICMLKSEYYDATKELYKKYKTPMSQWTDEQWDETMIKMRRNKDE